MPSNKVIVSMRAAQNSRKRFSPPPSMLDGFSTSGAMSSRLNGIGRAKSYRNSFEEMPVLEEVASESEF